MVVVFVLIADHDFVQVALAVAVGVVCSLVLVGETRWLDYSIYVHGGIHNELKKLYVVHSCL